MSLHDVKVVSANLKSATTFAAVFGTPPAADPKEQRSFVRRQFSYLAQVVHPDHVHEGHDIAEAAFEHLRNLYNAAEAALKAGTYADPFRAGHRHGATLIEDFFELRSPTACYRCDNTPYRVGDFSVLYRGKVDDRDILVKIASVPTSNALLETEAKRLKNFRDSKTMAGITGFLPELIDTFMVLSPDRKQFRANVISFKPAMLSLTDIMAAFSGALVPQHAAWIVRRVMAQTCAAAMAGLVHGSITPDHVLVDPIRHEPLHIGWLHAVAKPARITMLVERWRDWYPREVLEKKAPGHRTDIYMAGKTCIWLFGGNTKTNQLRGIPDNIVKHLMHCVEPEMTRRPDDGLKVLNDLTLSIREAWGRSYQPLLLPI